MKHILNNLSEEEKNSIREQHTDVTKIVTENFTRLINSKLGDVKTFISEQLEPTMKIGRLVNTIRGIADFTNIPDDKIQGMVNSYADLYNKEVNGESNLHINDYSILQQFPDEFNPHMFLKNPNDENVINVFMAITSFCKGTDNSLSTKFKTIKPKLENPFAFFSKPVELGALIDWWNNSINQNIIDEFINSEDFVPESATIFKNTKVPQIKVNVPQDFLTAYNEIQAKLFSISNGAAIFLNGSTGKGYKYVKTANGYVLNKYDRQ
jgi:hypothetical protein